MQAQRGKMCAGAVADIGIPAKCRMAGMQVAHERVAMDLGYERRRGDCRDLLVRLDEATHALGPPGWGMGPNTSIDDVLVRRDSGDELIECFTIGPSDALRIDELDRDRDDLDGQRVILNVVSQLGPPRGRHCLRVAQETDQWTKTRGEIIGEDNTRSD